MDRVLPTEAAASQPELPQTKATSSWRGRLFNTLTNPLITNLICPYLSIIKPQSDFYANQADINPELSGTFSTLMLQPEGIDGPKIEALKIIPLSQQSKPAEEQKWIVLALGNGMSHYDFFGTLLQFTQAKGVCCAVTHYRGISEDPQNRGPEKFLDLVADVDSLVQHLIQTRVKPGNMLMWGISLGGAVGAEVASRYQAQGDEMAYFGENTMDRMQDVAAALIPLQVKRSLEFLTEGGIEFLNQAGFGLAFLDGFLILSYANILYFLAFLCTPLAVTFRMSALTFLFFENLVYREFRESLQNIKEMGITLLQSLYLPVLLMIDIAHIAHKWIFRLPLNYDNHPFSAGRYLFTVYTPRKSEESALYRLVTCRSFENLVRNLIIQNGWDTATLDAWYKINGDRFASNVSEDQVIVSKASLVTAVRNKGGRRKVLMRQGNDHNSLLIFAEPDTFNKVIKDALKI